MHQNNLFLSIDLLSLISCFMFPKLQYFSLRSVVNTYCCLWSTHAPCQLIVAFVCYNCLLQTMFCLLLVTFSCCQLWLVNANSLVNETRQFIEIVYHFLCNVLYNGEITDWFIGKYIHIICCNAVNNIQHHFPRPLTLNLILVYIHIYTY